MALNFSSPILEINDVTVPYVSGSLKLNRGRGNVNVRSVSSGGGGTTIVATVDDSTRISNISFEVIPTNDQFRNERDWSALSRLVNGCTLRIPDSDPNNKAAAGTYTQMHLSEDREFVSGPDSAVTLTFMGNPG